MSFDLIEVPPILFIRPTNGSSQLDGKALNTLLCDKIKEKKTMPKLLALDLENYFIMDKKFLENLKEAITLIAAKKLTFSLVNTTAKSKEILLKEGLNNFFKIITQQDLDRLTIKYKKDELLRMQEFRDLLPIINRSTQLALAQWGIENKLSPVTRNMRKQQISEFQSIMILGDIRTKGERYIAAWGFSDQQSFNYFVNSIAAKLPNLNPKTDTFILEVRKIFSQHLQNELKNQTNYRYEDFEFKNFKVTQADQLQKMFSQNIVIQDLAIGTDQMLIILSPLVEIWTTD